MILYKTNLYLFDNTNVTTDTGLSDEMKTYYSDYLIDLAEPYLVHDQFGQKQPIPQNKGKTIEFRKYSPLPKALTPLTEGVTPSGQKLTMSVITATVAQYGGYVELSDMLIMTAIDNNQTQAVKLLAGQAGRTLDTITREVLAGGTNVQYAEGAHSTRATLVSGEATGNDYMTVDCVRKAVRYLKVMNAQKINGDFVGIIHPDVSYDLMSDPKWVNVKTYSDPGGIYEGEIGKIEGVRFVETSEAKVFEGTPLTAASKYLTVRSAVTSSTSVPVKEKITSADATALAGRTILIGSAAATIASATAGDAGAASITLSASGSYAQNAVVAPDDAGAGGKSVYATMILGENAYGVTEVAGGGLQYISKQLGSAGTADPLNQRATCGWKATKVAERLVEEYMVRIETTSTFSA